MKDGWQMVMALGGGGYGKGFDPAREYEFRRIGEESVSRFRMADTHPLFNVFGLMWREIETVH